MPREKAAYRKTKGALERWSGGKKTLITKKLSQNSIKE